MTNTQMLEKVNAHYGSKDPLPLMVEIPVLDGAIDSRTFTSFVYKYSKREKRYYLLKKKIEPMIPWYCL